MYIYIYILCTSGPYSSVLRKVWGNELTMGILLNCNAALQKVWADLYRTRTGKLQRLEGCHCCTHALPEPKKLIYI